MSERAYWGPELFELLLEGRVEVTKDGEVPVTLEKIAYMHPATVYQHIKVLRAETPDDIPLTDKQVADEIWVYAVSAKRPLDWF